MSLVIGVVNLYFIYHFLLHFYSSQNFEIYWAFCIRNLYFIIKSRCLTLYIYLYKQFHVSIIFLRQNLFYFFTECNLQGNCIAKLRYSNEFSNLIYEFCFRNKIITQIVKMRLYKIKKLKKFLLKKIQYLHFEQVIIAMGKLVKFFIGVNRL